jgi:hypothetical protein
MPLNDNYRPTKKDQDIIWTKFAATYLHGGPNLTSAESEFMRLVNEAFRIGSPRKAATIGQARASLKAMEHVRHAARFAMHPPGSGLLYDKDHSCAVVADKIDAQRRARILKDYEDHDHEN